MNETTNTNSQQPTTPTPEASGGQGERLFTQAELNQIISDRLARERAKSEPDEKEAALNAREKAVKAAEARLACRDYLDGKRLPVGLLYALDTTDAEAFKATVDKLAALDWSILNPQREKLVIPHVDNRGASFDAIAAAFKPKNNF